MEMVNGYVFLDLTKANVYGRALKVLGTDKPVVIKDGSGSPYFVDSLTLDGTNIIITKGGKTITIANNNTITNVGDIQPHLNHYRIEIMGENESEDERDILFDFYTFDTYENNYEITDFTLINKYITFYQLGLDDESDEFVVNGRYDTTNEQYNYIDNSGQSHSITKTNLSVKIFTN